MRIAPELIRAETGGLVLLDPGLSEATCDAVIEASRGAAAEVVFFLAWDKHLLTRIVSMHRSVRPLDIVFADADSATDRLRSICESPFESSLETLLLHRLDPWLSRLLAAERNLAAEIMVGPIAITSTAAFVHERGFAIRTLERHFAKVGLAPPRYLVRASAVAKSRRVLLGRAATLSMASEQGGFNTVSQLSEAFEWATGLGPRQAVASLSPVEFAKSINNRLTSTPLP